MAAWMPWLELATGTLVVATAVPAGWLVMQLLMARPAVSRSDAPRPASGGPDLCVLIPAHDEELGLPATLANVQAQLADGDRVLVVADNCSDGTAAVARQAGVLVVERRHETQRGKGYALQFGVDHLRGSGAPPAILVVVDADCTLQPGALDRLRDEVARTGLPAQALYLMQAPDSAPTLPQRVAAFAWRIKNWARAGAAHRLGLTCVLYGTGMAFPWPAIVDAPLASAHLVEDMQLGVNLAISGHTPRFCEAAVVVSQFPDNASAALRQRERWEHGHLQVIGRQVPQLVAQAVRHGRPRLLLAALDLAVPPLALMVSWTIALALATAVLAVMGAWWPLAAMALLLCALGAALVKAWQRFGTDLLSSADLLRLPSYVFSKMTIYLRYFSGYRAAWVRTSRTGEVDQT